MSLESLKRLKFKQVALTHQKLSGAVEPTAEMRAARRGSRCCCELNTRDLKTCGKSCSAAQLLREFPCHEILCQGSCKGHARQPASELCDLKVQCLRISEPFHTFPADFFFPTFETNTDVIEVLKLLKRTFIFPIFAFRDSKATFLKASWFQTQSDTAKCWVAAKN